MTFILLYIAMSPLLVLAVIVLFFVYVHKFVTYRPTKKSPPGPIRLPIWGSYLHVLWKDWKYAHMAFEKMKTQYKSPIIGLYIGGTYTVAANDYETCREIFTRPELQGRVEAFPVQFRMSGKKLGLFANDGDAWLHLRRFTLRELRDLGFGRRSEIYEGILEEEVIDLVTAINNECEDGRSVPVPEIFFHPFLNCIFYILTGSRLPLSESKKSKDIGHAGLEFITSVNITGCMIALLPWLRHFYPNVSNFKGLKKSSMVFERLIKQSFEEHEKTFDEEAIRDMVDVYLKNKKRYPHFTDEQLLITIIDFVFPNIAASAMLTYAIIYLIWHPRVMTKCQEEIDAVVGRGRLPNLNDRPRLYYVEATLREVMRRHTLTPLALAHRATEDTTFFGYDIPKDTMMVTNLWSLNMDKTVWGDPENFRPERFLDGDGHLNTAKDLSLPFGIGKRVCAGETFTRHNLFVLLASALQNFSFASDTPIDFRKNRSGVATVPQTDLKVTFLPR